MFITEQGTKRLAALGSLLIHLILLFAIIPIWPDEVIETQSTVYVPVEMVVIDTPAPQPKTKKVSKKRARITPKKKVKKVTPKPAPKVEEKPKEVPVVQTYPNDRPSPTIQSSISPVYPKQALNNNWSGKVRALFDIDETGKPTFKRLVSSSGHDILDQALIKTVLAYYTFSPKVEKDKPVKSTIEIAHEFK